LPYKATAKILFKERSRERKGLPPFAAVHAKILSSLEIFRDKGCLEDFNVVAYHPAADPTQIGSWPQSGWFVVVEMPGGAELLRKHGSSGVFYDDKEKV
jgi:hypothetical protein